MKLLKINGFEWVYLAIATATFQHTCWAAATTFSGPLPSQGTDAELFFWYLNGILIATAIDIGMFVTAKELRYRRNIVLILGFVLAASASFYTQVLYSAHHTGEFTFGSGVNSYWLRILEPFIHARVVILPFILPLFGVVYTVAQLTVVKANNPTKVSGNRRKNRQGNKKGARASKSSSKGGDSPEGREGTGEALTFTYGDRTYGPYSSKKSLRAARRRVGAN